MKSLNEIYQKHQPPFEDRDLHGGDKGTNHSYIEVYEALFKDFREQPIDFLEIGVQSGYSLRMWAEYFPLASIFGADIDPSCLRFRNDRTKVAALDSTNPLEVFKTYPFQTFNLIIDDGSHQILDQVRTFHLFFPKLKNGGIYVIEDIANLDLYRDLLQSLHPKMQIADRRYLKSRGDDVLGVIRKD